MKLGIPSKRETVVFFILYTRTEKPGILTHINHLPANRKHSKRYHRTEQWNGGRGVGGGAWKLLAEGRWNLGMKYHPGHETHENPTKRKNRRMR